MASSENLDVSEGRIVRIEEIKLPRNSVAGRSRKPHGAELVYEIVKFYKR